MYDADYTFPLRRSVELTRPSGPGAEPATLQTIHRPSPRSVPLPRETGAAQTATAPRRDEGATHVRALPRPERRRIIEWGRLKRALWYLKHVEFVAPGLADVRSKSRADKWYRVSLDAEDGRCGCEDEHFVGVMCVHEIAFRLRMGEEHAMTELQAWCERGQKNRKEAGIDNGESAA